MMNEMNKYEQLHEIATRDWFKSSSVSLAKLDEIKASVYNITPDKGQQSSRPTSSAGSRSRGHRGQSYTDLQAEPPLSTVGVHTWGSNQSIPNLIKQQEERKRQGQVTSATGTRRRPWSGRKVPPSPTQQAKPERQAASPQADKYKAFIAVKGSKYDPLSRPPSGRSSVPTEGVPSGSHGQGISKRAADVALDDFLKAQANGDMHDIAKLSAAYANEDAVTTPPPAPCASPDIHQMLYGDGPGLLSDDEEMEERVRLAHMKEVTVKQSSVPQLLRRPTPEPVRLSMTIPMMGNVYSDEDECDEEFGVDRYADSPSVDMEVQSVTSEVSGQLEGNNDATTQSPDVWTGGIRSVTLTSNSRHLTTTTPVPVADSEDAATCVNAAEGEGGGVGRTRAAKHSVHINEECNTTFEISGSDPTSHNRPGSLVPHPPAARRRPQSARKHHDIHTGSGSGRGYSKSADGINKDAGARHSRPKSARTRSLKISTVAIDYGADGELKQDQSDELAGKESKIKRRPEIETMMSRMSLSDDDDDGGNDGSTTVNGAAGKNVQYSTTSDKTNFYKMATAPPDHQKATLTTKTIAFSDAGILESKTVSRIGQQQLAEKPPVTMVGRIGLHSRTHSAITRPVRSNTSITNGNPPARPTSRMGSRPDDDEDFTVIDESSQDNDTTRKISRPASAPVKRRGKAFVPSSAKKNPSKTTRGRPKSATTPQKQNYIDKPHIALQPNSQSMKGISQPKKSLGERERNRAAVKALREGTLNKEKKYSGKIAFEETKKVIEYTPRREESTSESSSEEEIEVPLSEQEKQMQEMHERLLAKGVNVSAKTLARGLLPPTQREYDDCTSNLPQKPSITLLNHPEAWLGEVFKKYQMAERALHRANVRMIEQSESDAKRLAARQALESGKKKKRKKGKKKKGKKKTTKTSTASGNVT